MARLSRKFYSGGAPETARQRRDLLSGPGKFCQGLVLARDFPRRFYS